MLLVGPPMPDRSNDQDKIGYSGPPGWGLGVRLQTSSRIKYCCETSRGGQGPPRAVEPMMMVMMMMMVMIMMISKWVTECSESYTSQMSNLQMLRPLLPSRS